MLRTYEGKQAFKKIDFQFDTAVDLNKCPKHIKLPIKLYTDMSKHLPSNISTMVWCSVDGAVPVLDDDQGLLGDLVLSVNT